MFYITECLNRVQVWFRDDRTSFFYEMKVYGNTLTLDKYSKAEISWLVHHKVFQAKSADEILVRLALEAL